MRGGNVQTAICHYSYHRTWDREKWDCIKLAETVKGLGVDAIDFHARLLGNPGSAAKRVTEALDRTGLILSGLSFSNNFNQEDPAEMRQQIDSVIEWIGIASELKAPVSRIFGGHVADRSDKAALDRGFERIIEGLRAVVEAAEKSGVILALENHGGLPCSGEEQVKVIETIGSANLRATIDVGNYMQCNQEGHEGTAVAARYAAYVHFKDFKRKPGTPKGIEPCTVGQGDVDHARCLQALLEAGYGGFVALEYEGLDDEMRGVEASAAYMKDVVSRAG
jgi:sugar phosphate isomerase/epimerase